MSTSQGCSPAAERMLFTLHHMLDCACSDRGKVPIGASALLQRAIDEMRADGVPAEEVRRAETVAVSLHQLEWAPPSDQDEATAGLATLREGVRRLLSGEEPFPAPGEGTETNARSHWTLGSLVTFVSGWCERLRTSRFSAA